MIQSDKNKDETNSLERELRLAADMTSVWSDIKLAGYKGAAADEAGILRIRLARATSVFGGQQ